MKKRSTKSIVLRQTRDFSGIEDFWTKGFKNSGLERLEKKEFYEVDKRVWRKRINRYKSDMYCIVENPIEAGDYRELIDILLEYDSFFRLWVRSNEGWMKAYREQLTPDVVTRMVKIAEENIWKKNYFDAKFTCSPDCDKSGVIGFTEYGGRIVGYDVSLPYEQRSLVTIEGPGREREFGYIHGLWLPKDQAPTHGPRGVSEKIGAN